MTIGIDVGTQGTKAIVYDDQLRRKISSASVSYGILPSKIANRKEQHPATWVDAAFSGVKAALKGLDARSVKAVSVSGQQHGMVALDGAGDVVRPAKLWCDVESDVEAGVLSEMVGWTLVPAFTATKLLWMKNNEPENFARTRRVLLPHDYMNFVLTGEYAMECGDASGTGFLNADRGWNEDMMRMVDDRVPEMFPKLLGPEDQVGNLLQNVAEDLGLSKDVVVGPGSGDNMMSALGAGAVVDGVVVLSLGTSGTIFGCSSSRSWDASGCVAPFCDATGRWLPLLCTMSCTGALEEVRSGYGMDHAELTKLASAENAGCDGVNFLPYLTGERTPNWPKSSGAILGLRPGQSRPGLIYRAAMEGATFTLLAGLKRMQETGFVAKELRVVGGGSNNPLWRRIVADAFQLPLSFPKEPESAALGAALQAGAVVEEKNIREYVLEQEVELEPDIIEPNPEMRDFYEAAFTRHCDLGNLLYNT